MPRRLRRSQSPGSSRNRLNAAWREAGSFGGTSSPSSPTTSGSAPLALATTGTPDAWASTTTLPNCSTHPGQQVEPAVDSRDAALVDVAVEGDAVAEAEAPGQGHQAPGLGAGPEDLDDKPFVAGGRLQ